MDQLALIVGLLLATVVPQIRDRTRRAVVSELGDLLGRGRLGVDPRPDDVGRASQAGVTAIVSKPYRVRDLLWHLAEAIRLDARLPGTQTR